MDAFDRMTHGNNSLMTAVNIPYGLSAPGLLTNLQTAGHSFFVPCQPFIAIIRLTDTTDTTDTKG